MHTLQLTLWGDFVEIEGAHLHNHPDYENILLTSRVHVKSYEGTLTIPLKILFKKSLIFHLIMAYICIHIFFLKFVRRDIGFYFTNQ